MFHVEHVRRLLAVPRVVLDIDTGHLVDADMMDRTKAYAVAGRPTDRYVFVPPELAQLALRRLAGALETGVNLDTKRDPLSVWARRERAAAGPRREDDRDERARRMQGKPYVMRSDPRWWR